MLYMELNRNRLLEVERSTSLDPFVQHTEHTHSIFVNLNVTLIDPFSMFPLATLHHLLLYCRAELYKQ